MATQKRILVIGATGMTGKPVARKLHQGGYQVRVPVPDIDRARSIQGTNFEFVEGDVIQPETVTRALENCYGVHIRFSVIPSQHSKIGVCSGRRINVMRLSS